MNEQACLVRCQRVDDGGVKEDRGGSIRVAQLLPTVHAYKKWRERACLVRGQRVHDEGVKEDHSRSIRVAKLPTTLPAYKRWKSMLALCAASACTMEA